MVRGQSPRRRQPPKNFLNVFIKITHFLCLNFGNLWGGHAGISRTVPDVQGAMALGPPPPGYATAIGYRYITDYLLKNMICGKLETYETLQNAVFIEKHLVEFDLKS